jgi:hypothetical protein
MYSLLLPASARTTRPPLLRGAAARRRLPLRLHQASC